MSACGNKTKSGEADADSTQVFEVPDTLNTVEAVIQQVDSAYAYWNYQEQEQEQEGSYSKKSAVRFCRTAFIVYICSTQAGGRASESGLLG